MNEYAPFVRIVLRYLAGAGAIGSHLTMDSDVIALGCLIVGAVVERSYARAKKTGGAT